MNRMNVPGKPYLVHPVILSKKRIPSFIHRRVYEKEYLGINQVIQTAYGPHTIRDLHPPRVVPYCVDSHRLGDFHIGLYRIADHHYFR